MICIARTFGAPETVPAGNVARSRSNDVTPSRSSPATSDTRCVTCEKRSGSRKRSTFTVPGTQTRERSLRPRSTSMMCSARSFSDASSYSASPSPRRDRPRDRVEAGASRLGLHVRLGRRPDERDSVQLQQEEVRRRVDPSECAVDGERRDAVVVRSARCESDDLEDVAATDVLLRARDAALVLRAVREARSGPGADGAGGPASIPPASSARALVGVAAQHLGRAASRGRSARTRRRRRSGSRARPARRRAARPSARASRRGRSRGSRRPPRRAPPPPRSDTSRSPQPTNE